MKSKFITSCVGLMLVMASVFVPSPSFASGEAPCVEGGTVTLADVAQGLQLCGGAIAELQITNDLLSIPIPEPGIYQAIDFAENSSGVGEVGLIRSALGDVSAVVDGIIYGNSSAFTAQSSAIVTASTVPGCSAASYIYASSKWATAWRWYYNSTSQADTASLAAIQGAFNLWTSGANRCTGAIYNSSFVNTYIGGTSKATNVTTAAGCAAPDGFNVVGWGALPTGVLALTCRYSMGTAVFEADMKFNSAISFYTGSSTGSCTGAQFDLREIAAHEAGHVVNLAHSPQSDSQLMKPGFNVCETNQRLLAPGDILGLLANY